MVEFDQFRLDPAAAFFEIACDIEPDVPAAGDDDPSAKLLLLAEDRQRPLHPFRRRHHIDGVACNHMVAGTRDEHRFVPQDADDSGVQVGEQFRQLPQRRIDDRAILAAIDAENRDLLVGERDGLGRSGLCHPTQHHLADLDLGRDDHVDRHVFTGKQVAPALLQIALFADAGDLGRQVEQRMGHLARDHVNLVMQGDRDDHVRLVRAGALQHVGVGSVTDKAADVERVADRTDQFRRLVDDRYIIVLAGQFLGNAEAHLAGAANDHSHRLMPPI